MSQPLTSSNMRTNSVVVHITVPRQIGRKRKQGPIPTHQHEQISTGPLLENHMEAASMPIVSIRDKVPTANTVLRILEDNPNRYTVQVVGIIDQTHRFRGKSSSIGAINVYLPNSQTCQTLCILPLVAPLCKRCAGKYCR